MLKRFPNLVWFFLFVMFVQLFVGEVLRASQHSQQDPRVQAQQQSENGIGVQQNVGANPSSLENQSSQAQNKHRSHDAAEIAFLGVRPGEWLIGFVTFLLCVSTQLLVREAKKSSERQLRAYVSVTPTVGAGIFIGQIPKIGFTIANAGKTPAYNFRYVALVDIFEHPLVDDQGDLALPVEGQPLPKRPIHPGSHIKGEAAMNKPLTQDDLTKILVGEGHRLYVAGLVLYEDAFGIERRTQFAAYIGGPELAETIRKAKIAAQSSDPVLIDMDWTFSHVHNEAT